MIRKPGLWSGPLRRMPNLSRKANEFNYRIYCDRDGLVWIGYWISTDNGINQIVTRPEILPALYGHHILGRTY